MRSTCWRETLNTPYLPCHPNGAPPPCTRVTRCDEAPLTCFTPDRPPPPGPRVAEGRRAPLPLLHQARGRQRRGHAHEQVHVVLHPADCDHLRPHSDALVVDRTVHRLDALSDEERVAIPRPPHQV